MKKICLCVVGIYLNLLAAFSQTAPQQDSTAYYHRKLKIEEMNLVSSYYQQNGNNSAITGGIGTEKLTDFANSFDLKLSKYDKHFRKHIFNLDLGVDSYTSASSDKVDPGTISSASAADIRFYPSLTWSMENEKKRTSIGASASSSFEYDYQSFGLGVNFAKKSKDNNLEVSVKLQTYLDQVTIIKPIELRNGSDDGGRSPRNTYNGSFSISQIINKRLQVLLLADVAYQKGYLGLPFHRVYFNDNSLRVENLPNTRLKIPIGLRLNYFLGGKIVLRSLYRFYKDDWGLTAHTADLEATYKITPFFSISPFYRFYTQSSIDYFAPYKMHNIQKTFYTSNYDLSKFNSGFFGAGFRFTPPDGVFGIKHWNMIELRYGHYNRSTVLAANIISLNLKFK